LTGLQMSKAEQERIGTKVVYLRDELGLEFYVIAKRFGLHILTIKNLYQKEKGGDAYEGKKIR